MYRRLLSYVLVVFLTLVLAEVFHPMATLSTLAQGGCQTFPETKKTLCGKFLTYWQQHGGLAQQGFPISGAFQEVSDLNGKTYTVQYFERAVFEDHPENQPPNDVLLSQLGTFQFKRKYPSGEPSGAPQPTTPPTPPTAVPPAGGAKLDLVDVQVEKRSFGGSRAIGYVKNTGSVELSSVQIVATLKDAGGKIVGTGSDSATLLRPNELYPFDISSSTEFATAAIQLSYHEASASAKKQYYRDFAVSDTNVVPPGSYGHAKIVGNVKNTGTGTGYLIEVHVLVTDGGGKTLDVSSSFVELDELGPGQTSPFEVGLNVDSVPNFQLLVEGFGR